MLRRAEGLIGLGRAEEALAITTDVPASSDSLYLRAECLARGGDFRRARAMCESGLRLPPRSGKCAAARELFEGREADDAATQAAVESGDWGVVEEEVTSAMGRAAKVRACESLWRRQCVSCRSVVLTFSFDV